MRSRLIRVLILLSGLAHVAAAEDGGPRTGYFETETTVVELLGPERAAAMSDLFAADEKLQWKIYVPQNYTPAKPAGVLVYITHSNSWGGSTRSYNDVLDEKNLIWAGVIGAGDKKPMDARMMRALLTPTFLAKSYALDPERLYVGGTSGGAHVAAILATSKPQLFKGGLFIGGALSWKDKVPAGIDYVRQNRFAFLAGSNHPALKQVQSTALAYREAGVEHAKFISMANVGRKAPTATYIRAAIEHLDGNNDKEADE
ncbi:MAG: hypothetical protein OEY37_04220 [Gammaproteobacteria bacterium]|nr:hypothetical protein [Gammaproteobacteria bacterium]